MSTAKRLDIEEGKDLVALEELERRDITYCLRRVSRIGSLLPAGAVGEQRIYSICRCAEAGGTVPLMILQKMQAAEDILCDEVEYIR